MPLAQGRAISGLEPKAGFLVPCLVDKVLAEKDICT